MRAAVPVRHFEQRQDAVAIVLPDRFPVDAPPTLVDVGHENALSMDAGMPDRKCDRLAARLEDMAAEVRAASSAPSVRRMNALVV